MKEHWRALAFAAVVTGVAATVWYLSLPCGYEASSGFLYDLRGHMRTNGMSFSADVGDTFAEIYFTRLPEWKSERVVRKTILFYRKGLPVSNASDADLLRDLNRTRFELMRGVPHVIQISVRSRTPEVCSGLANAYVEAIAAYTEEETKIRCEKALAQIHANVERQRRRVGEIELKLAQLDSSPTNEPKRITLQTDLSQQLDVLEALIRNEVEVTKRCEQDSEVVAFAWRAEVPNRPVLIWNRNRVNYEQYERWREGHPSKNCDY